MKRIFSVVLILTTFTISAQDRSQWFEFYLPWDDSTKTITDMSAYLDAPAGKYGYLQTTPDGHFRFENKDQDERFVGVVNVAIANFPTKDQARILAARMAKFGINLVRIHLIDVEGTSGLFQNSSLNTLQLSVDRLDKMDYFIKCLKDKGIYFNFCIQSGRVFKTADGLNAPVTNNQSKYVTIFDPKIIDLQKDFAEKTIGHVNPYTGLTYANDPAMATVELTNENSLFNGWFGWESDKIFSDNTEGIGTYYSAELDSMFNEWLSAKYSSDEELSTTWGKQENIAENELVKNGSFEQNLTGWSTWINSPTVTGSFSIDNSVAKNGSKSLKAIVTKTGEYGWYFQMKTNNFSVEKNGSYKLAFYVKADVEKELQVEIMENDTWKYISGPMFTTTADWKLVEIYFTSTFQTNKLIAQFDFGKQSGTFWLDSVSITPFNGVGLEPGESLEVKNIKRTKATDVGKYTPERIADNTEFYFETEKNYTNELSGYLKNDLGVKCPVTFTNNYYGLASVYSQAQADYIDFHMYWNHPNFPNGWSETNFTMNNQSILLNPEGSTFNQMMLTKVKNMPHVLSEYNHPYPYIYQLEAPSLIYAYSSFFDLDGVMWHAYYDYMNRFSQRYQDMFFDIAMHPVMMTQMLLALPYRMHYIQPAQTFVEADYKSEDIFKGTKIYQDESVINLEDASKGTAFLQHGFRNASFTADSSFITGTLSNPGKVITSETGELKWDGDQGIFTVDNSYWQGATGFLGGKTVELGNIAISDVSTTDNLNFAAIHLISLDSLPIEQSKRMLLLTSARLENSGLKWNTEKTSLVSVGTAPALCEPIKATLHFNPARADSFMVYQLDETGKRIDSLLIMPDQEGSVSFTADKKTLWYEISNHRFHDTPQGNNTQLKNDKNSMKIYPNPGKNSCMLEFLFPDNSNAEFVLYNSTGILIQNENLKIANAQLNKKRLDLTGLSNGIYFCGFQLNNGEKILEKLIVRN